MDTIQCTIMERFQYKFILENIASTLIVTQALCTHIYQVSKDNNVANITALLTQSIWCVLQSHYTIDPDQRQHNFN